MTKVSFYLFKKSNERQVESTCRLCRKILRKNAKIWLYCADLDLQQQLDERLWSFDPSSFLAHSMQQSDAPICISAQLPDDNDWIVFNFNNPALEQFSQIGHIIEIIENDEAAKVIGREKFKTYRRLGLQPQTFKL
ncbi:DNA polymerase III chi subunit [Acinetobacter calcoaceticus]|uniref:DNA polymerase III chi subunit n=1 Tax=Acinetobacter calcoaceticus TaxID=471 RepID=A0A4R1Y7G2_ACICA|nr:DNA polymerase III chi subunit [Acinetobacter calcoaceticus]